MKLKHGFLFMISIVLIFSCDLFKTGGTGTLIFKGVSQLPDLSKSALYLDETVTDYDGNIYETVTIGDQVWMVQNLKVTHYKDGSPIGYITDSTDWSQTPSPGFCYYNNDPAYADTFGCLYNWYVVSGYHGTLAPEGWHIASDDDWKQLEMYLGMSQEEANTIGFRGTNEGKKLKSTYRWTDHDGGSGNGTDEVGFTALPGGYRMNDGTFENLGLDASFWTSTDESESDSAWWRDIYNNRDEIRRYSYDKNLGLYVRCVKDTDPVNIGNAMEMTGAAFNIHEMWVSQSLVSSGVVDDFEWHLIGEDQGLVLMDEVEIIADELPTGQYKSLKIVFRNQFVRHGRFVSDTSRTMGFESGIGTDIADSSFMVDYFSSGGSYYYDDGAFVLMASGENMPAFDINADATTTIYWKGGGPETKWTDMTFDWHDYNGDGLWTPGIDMLNNFEEPEGIPMWTFMVVEE